MLSNSSHHSRRLVLFTRRIQIIRLSRQIEELKKTLLLFRLSLRRIQFQTTSDTTTTDSVAVRLSRHNVLTERGNRKRGKRNQNIR